MSNLRDRVKKGEDLIGAMITVRSQEAAELMGQCGFDFLLIDSEHAAFGPETIQDLVRAIEKTPAVPLVRVPQSARAYVQWALDSGAQGILFPQISTAEEASQAVSLCRYPPAGVRGLGPGRAQGYGANLVEYESSANETILVMVQIENLTALDNLDQILAVAGIDLVFVGPGDLSSVLGVPGQLNHPHVVAAVERVIAACRDHQLPVGTLGLDGESRKLWRGQGARFLILGTDTAFLSGGARSATQAARQEIANE